MYIKSWLAFTLIISTLDYTRGYQRINVTVYYETLSWSSVSFIQKQLKPVWKDLHDYLNVSLVPFGKAKQRMGKDGQLQFVCNHGGHECLGNKIQACALRLLENNTYTSVAYVLCFMQYENLYPYQNNCFAESVGYENQELIDKYKDCLNNSTKGNEALMHYGISTSAVTPPIHSFPSIAVNGVQNREMTIKARIDLRLVVCNLMEKQPPKCNETTTEPNLFIVSYDNMM